MKKTFSKRNYLRIPELLSLFISSFSTIAVAQQYQPYLNIPVTVFGNTQVNPWTGGFDAPALFPIDLNSDGIKDLFAFEKGGASKTFYRYSTFINNGTANTVDYHYAPEYKKKFPDSLYEWVVLADYNCDGKEDLFAYDKLGHIRVYRNTFDSITGLNFTLAYSPPYTYYFGNYSPLIVSANGQPAITDIDNDGDMDLLIIRVGFTIEYHQNLAMDSLGLCDTLIFNMATQCWGDMSLNDFVNSATLGVVCRSSGQFSMPAEGGAQLHGGSCLIAPDLDGDGDKDVINGDILGYNLLMLHNGGDSSYADITTQDSIFPAYDFPVSFKTFPSAYYFDADNDGNKDMAVASCIAGTSRNFNNVLFYKNITNNQTNVFSFQQNDLLVNNMIEVGSGANVALFDADADGLKDIIIGNFQYVYQTGSNSCRMAYYRNNGSATAPSFDFESSDYADVGSLNINAASPTFGDLDGDGDEDMIVGAYDGFINYYQNTAVAGNPANFILMSPHMTDANNDPIFIGSNAAPVLVDLNRDGKLDLVIGEKTGNLNYYENTGTTAAWSFSLVTNTLGGVDVVKHAVDLYGYSAPFFYDSLGDYKLFVGSLSGYIYKYDNIDGNLAGNFNLVDSMLIYEPVQSTITGGDINNDGKLDLLIGNYAGGATWYMDQSTALSEITAGDFNSFIIYPNPVKNNMVIQLTGAVNQARKTMIITDLLGNLIMEKSIKESGISVDVGSLANGMYICKVMDNYFITSKKFIIIN